uniref:Uncharacterized protein n=1 Tax=Cacopsylla melanoneura TaxID=428564 RepID=A0A8D8V4Y7_9HEMI
MENLVKFRCLGVVLCCAFQVNEVFGRKEAYINYDPTYPEPKFKLPLSRWDGEDPCDAFTNPADRTVNNLCQTDIKNTLEKDNGWSKLEVLCTNTGNLPVCCLKKQNTVLGLTRRLCWRFRCILEQTRRCMQGSPSPMMIK